MVDIVNTRKVTTPHLSLLRAKHYKGVYSRVARQLGVSRVIVARVGSEGRGSKRVMAALVGECRRIERAIEKLAREQAA